MPTSGLEIIACNPGGRPRDSRGSQSFVPFYPLKIVSIQIYFPFILFASEPLIKSPARLNPLIE